VGLDATAVIRNWIASLLPGYNPAFAGTSLLRETRFVVVDTELTSLESRSNRIVSIGALAMEGTAIRLGEQFYRIVNPGENLPAESILVHELRPADVAAGDVPAVVVREFHEFAKDSVLVGHFVGIDIKALRKELQETFNNPFLDTAKAYHWLQLHGERVRGLDEVAERMNLASLAERYGLDGCEAHHALCDAYVTAQLWQRLLIELESAGITTLSQALRIARG
jgi:DNA polymerase-3 subunit epsilon